MAALSGILFPGEEEAAYSNFRLWESTGSAITYVYNPYLCTNVKLYLLLGLLLIGVSGYTVIEVKEHRARLKESDGNGVITTSVKNCNFDLIENKRLSDDVTDN